MRVTVPMCATDRTRHRRSLGALRLVPDVRLIAPRLGTRTSALADLLGTHIAAHNSARDVVGVRALRPQLPVPDIPDQTRVVENAGLMSFSTALCLRLSTGREPVVPGA